MKTEQEIRQKIEEIENAMENAKPIEAMCIQAMLETLYWIIGKEY